MATQWIYTSGTGLDVDKYVTDLKLKELRDNIQRVAEQVGMASENHGWLETQHNHDGTNGKRVDCTDIGSEALLFSGAVYYDGTSWQVVQRLTNRLDAYRSPAVAGTGKWQFRLKDDSGSPITVGDITNIHVQITPINKGTAVAYQDISWIVELVDVSGVEYIQVTTATGGGIATNIAFSIQIWGTPQ